MYITRGNAIYHIAIVPRTSQEVQFRDSAPPHNEIKTYFLVLFTTLWGGGGEGIKVDTRQSRLRFLESSTMILNDELNGFFAVTHLFNTY